MAKYKTGVFGSAEGQEVKKIKIKAVSVGRELYKKNCVLVTGASTGLPYYAALEMTRLGGEVWGFAPTTSIKDLDKVNKGCDNSIYTKLFFIPKSFLKVKDLEICRKYRNVLSTADCDAGIIISGRWGTMHEFCNLHDMGKVVGVLTKTGGIANELPRLYKNIAKKSKAKVIFNSNPKELVGLVIKELEKRKKYSFPLRP